MNGCRFEEKSFTVAMGEGKANYPCCICGKESGQFIRKHNGDIYCEEHFPKVKKQSIAPEVFNTPSDTFSNFVDTKNFGKPMHFSSLTSFERECKKRGLHPLMSSDMKRKMDNPKHPDFKTTPHKEVKECIIGELKQKGLWDKLGRRK